MIKFVKVAGISSLFLLGIRSEASYFDSAFELNKSGYLYNLGAKGYIGRDTAKKEVAKILEEPRLAIRFRSYLNGKTGDAGFVFIEDKKMEAPETPGNMPGKTEIFGKDALKTCGYSVPRKVVLDSYDASSHFGFFITPPVLLHENAFNLMVGNECITVDKETNMLMAAICVDSPNEDRNYQMFSWVDSGQYNRGVDPITYRPNPNVYAKNKPDDDSRKEECKKHKVSGVFHAHLKNPSNLAFDGPYRPEHGRSQQPDYCGH
ncbi:hypothetical protein NEPAR06_0711 [Nematocida parisii]|uniref:Uncharacterized protein n=1 Tax=Nematocida parisii (strain ERTm3) TaxID=935791 RepID=I3EHU0_NEMP3|nr:uncharacterized protein NEPG_02386 [Nematocida parisii ERTm1]EIJ88787.1 hypothetical protein NEQG_00606 [Nematocida parisii ERTm3]KAI5125812.1 hypothetical protein NEPAR03_0249 [Nematocida parisii]EIJ92695.1 hypothetical protein NEPG_02386 [Nematocida parisii ERTm1]KAI5126761.1 hypothetical protein NEPAR08_0613 [Nematocida parisii]KAI5140949.1 hypothetical protein NEPAR04_0610 [Nematocida parisii]|eukprot:XP_013060213.1 hypothetical protein NEPG_02386 [Nematocida parisii ERTm1]